MTLRLLCNENVPRVLVMALRALGHDTAWVSEVAPGSTDAAVLVQAHCDTRICVTFDKDFGELAARAPTPAGCGVILLRLATYPPAEAASRIAGLIDGRRGWGGHFSVIEPGRTRMRRLEPQSP